MCYVPVFVCRAAGQQQVSLTFDDGEDQRVQLIVHSLKPPFLDGRVSFSMQQVSRGHFRVWIDMRPGLETGPGGGRSGEGDLHSLSYLGMMGLILETFFGLAFFCRRFEHVVGNKRACSGSKKSEASSEIHTTHVRSTEHHDGFFF